MELRGQVWVSGGFPEAPTGRASEAATGHARPPRWTSPRGSQDALAAQDSAQASRRSRGFGDVLVLARNPKVAGRFWKPEKGVRPGSGSVPWNAWISVSFLGALAGSPNLSGHMGTARMPSELSWRSGWAWRGLGGCGRPGSILSEAPEGSSGLGCAPQGAGGVAPNPSAEATARGRPQTSRKPLRKTKSKKQSNFFTVQNNM